MRRVVVTLFVVIVLLAGLGAGSYFYYHNNADEPLTDPTGTISITVAENETLYQVLDRLEAEGTLKNAWLSKAYYKLSGFDLGIESGRHEAEGNARLKELLTALKSENLDNVSFTIPEGFTVDNMARRIAESGLFTKDEFLAAVKDFQAPAYVPSDSERRYQMEGYLWPDTYTFTNNTTAREVVLAMSNGFSDNLAEILLEAGRDNVLPEDYDDIINKAAMIERETNVDHERELVASVIENRLAQGMKLQLDATILYARGVDQKVIMMEDILFENPYNTYHVEGLPLGPICSPSRESIQAVLHPAETNYLYYLLNPETRRHFFTDDYSVFEIKREEYYGNGEASTQPQESTKAEGSSQPWDTIPENPLEGPGSLPFEVIPREP